MASANSCTFSICNIKAQNVSATYNSQSFFTMQFSNTEQVEVFFIYQLMQNGVVLETILKFTLKLTLKQLHVLM
jgi:hypothetical protein